MSKNSMEYDTSSQFKVVRQENRTLRLSPLRLLISQHPPSPRLPDLDGVSFVQLIPSGKIPSNLSMLKIRMTHATKANYKQKSYSTSSRLYRLNIKTEDVEPTPRCLFVSNGAIFLRLSYFETFVSPDAVLISIGESCIFSLCWIPVLDSGPTSDSFD